MSAPWVETTHRVTWNEVDAGNGVWYGVFSAWSDMGREALAREAGIEYTALKMVTTELFFKYIGVARWQDEIVIRTRMNMPLVGRTQFDFEFYRRLGRELLATGHTVHAMLDENGQPMRQMTPYLEEKITGFIGASLG